MKLHTLLAVAFSTLLINLNPARAADAASDFEFIKIPEALPDYDTGGIKTFDQFHDRLGKTLFKAYQASTKLTVGRYQEARNGALNMIALSVSHSMDYLMKDDFKRAFDAWVSAERSRDSRLAAKAEHSAALLPFTQTQLWTDYRAYDREMSSKCDELVQSLRVEYFAKMWAAYATCSPRWRSQRLSLSF
jgi:hypothetical protein